MKTVVLGPRDETFAKLPFYASHELDEVMVVDPDERRVRIFVLGDSRYTEAERSALLNIDVAGLEEAITWP